MSEDKRYFKFNEIHVIESLDDDEIQTGEQLYNDILRYLPLKMQAVKCNLHKVHNKIELLCVLRRIYEDVVSHRVHPYLHFEIHGSKEGLGLNSGELVSWKEIADLLREINTRTRNNVMVSLATCYGAHIYKNILPSLRCPFFAFIGPWETVTAGEVMVSFTSFFGYILECGNLGVIDFDVAVERMGESATLHGKFGFYLSEVIFDRIAMNIDKRLKDPQEFEKQVKGLVKNSLKMPGVRGRFTKKELRKKSKAFVKNPRARRKKMKDYFLHWDLQ